jgi:hypothetical protein
MPLKIFEKVSPLLKFRWPSSEVWDRPLPPLLTPIRSCWAWLSTSWPHGERRVELTFDFTDVETDAECGPGERRGKTDGQRQFARRQNWFTDVIDATPCALLLWQ